jgi:Zn-dependent M28 family amino/carboxypeptidase
MPGDPLRGPLPPATRAESELIVRLQAHVRQLATVIGPRNEAFPDALERAADYIEQTLTGFGYRAQIDSFGEGRFRNITVTLAGARPEAPMIVLGAHYDTAPTGTPGADDNASGVAALLEIARALQGTKMQRTVRFVAFPNEELPYFSTELMGSRVSAAAARAAGDKLLGMFALETLGYYSDVKGSQQYPPVVRQIYPDTGNIGAFREQAVLPSEGMAVPAELVWDVRRSDNSSYWDYGYAAVMVTDTANFRNPNYHAVTDTAETLDYERLARVTQGLTGMVVTLASTVD